MSISQINNFMAIDENQIINYNRDIIVNDLEGNTKVVVKCYCTIVSGKSISYNMDVIEPVIFEQQANIIQEQVAMYKEQATALAKSNNVPII